MTTALKNLYEDLIDGMMIEEVSGIDAELKALLVNAPIAEKRSLILTALVENNVEHRLLGNKIQKMVQENTLYSARHIKNVVRMLREYVGVSATARKLGEVMTPTSLVMDMLNTLPKDMWSNPDLKWLDPCNGVGIFPAVVIDRLMEGLIDFEPNEELRYKHIMEEMIYVGELQAKNLFLFLYAFDPEDRFALNVYNGSYLDEGFDNHCAFWGVEKFDVIVMNPPYNASNANSGSSHTLWDEFVIKTISNLIEGGYLVAIHPSGWRELGRGYKEVKPLLKSKEMVYLEVHNVKDGQKTFGAETSYDFYCLRNIQNNGFKTKIKFMDGKIRMFDISKLEFIPNGMFDEYQNLIAKDDEEKVNVLKNSSYHTQKEYISNEEDEIYKYPCVYMTRKDASLALKYSSRNDKGHFGIPKVIWSNGRTNQPINDIEGVYGLNEFSYAIIDDISNLEKIRCAMMNPKFWDIMILGDGNTGHRYKQKIIATFRKDFWKEFV